MPFRIALPPLLLAVLLALPARADYLPRNIYLYDVSLEEFPITALTRMEDSVESLWTQSGNAGFDPFLYYWGDFLASPVGGKTPAASWMQLLIFGGEFDLEKIAGWSGGSLFVSAVDAAGSNLSLDIGNLFTVSQAYVMNTFSLYDLYFKQRWLDDKLEFRIGRMSAGQYFATLPAMGLVVSGAVNGNPTSLFVNAPFHSTASASWAAYAKFRPLDQFYFDAGIFQASPRTGNPAYHGADFSIRSDDGILLMSEAGWTPVFGAEPKAGSAGKKSASANPGLPGIYTFGGYYSRYTFEKFAGGTERNACGFYGLAQQMIWRNPLNENNNLSLWAGLTYSPQQSFALMPLMGMGGVIWQGFIPKRDSDSTLFSVYSGGFSRDYSATQVSAGAGRATAETVLEWSYIIQLTKNVQLQPDLQYIIRPSGLGSIPNALVVGFQVSALF
ncbi:MAG TPA: carbohydrate porin [Chthoniobacterales bacterium]